jgi:hypothetical protein
VHETSRVRSRALAGPLLWCSRLLGSDRDRYRTSSVRRVREPERLVSCPAMLLIAAGQNLKRFLAARGWGRRQASCGSLLAIPVETWLLSAVSC